MTATLARPRAITDEPVPEPGPPCDCCGDRFAPKEKLRRGRLPLLICVEPAPCIDRAVLYGRWLGRSK